MQDAVQSDLLREMDNLDEEIGRCEPRLRHLVDYAMRHKAYSTAREMLFQHSVADSLLRRALGRLSNLRSIDISLGSHTVGAKEMRTDFGLVTHEEYEFNPIETVTRFVDALKEAPAKIKSFRFAQSDKSDNFDSDTDLGRQWTRADQKPSLLNASRQLDWSFLNSLELVYYDPNLYADHNPACSKFVIATENILSNAPQVKEFSLSLLTWVPTWPDTNALLGKIRLPQLERVSFLGLRIPNPENLVLFMKRHAPTLAFVSLDRVTCQVDEDKVLDQMAKVSYPRLKSCQITLKPILEPFEAAPFLRKETSDDPITACPEVEGIIYAEEAWYLYDEPSDPDDPAYPSPQASEFGEEDGEPPEEYDSQYSSDDSCSILVLEEDAGGRGRDVQDSCKDGGQRKSHDLVESMADAVVIDLTE